METGLEPGDRTAMRSLSTNAKRRWKCRMAKDLGLRKLNGVMRALLGQLWDIQVAMDAEPDPDKKMAWQRSYVRTVQTLGALRHK